MEDTFQLPGQFKRVTRTTRDMKDYVQVFVVNGENAWEKQGNGAARVTKDIASGWSEHPLAQTFTLLPFLAPDVRLTKLAGQAVDGRETVAIRAEGEDLGPFELFFDKETRLLRKARDLPPDGTDESAVMETLLDDYQTIQGGMVPMQIKRVRAGTVLIHATFRRVEFRDQFDDSVFAKP
jgi:hypothetical protein